MSDRKTATFLPTKKGTEKALNRINFEFNEHFRDYVSDIQTSHTLPNETAQGIIKNAFINARNSANNFDDQELGIHDWIENFIKQECEEHMAEYHSAKIIDQDTLESRQKLSDEIELAIDVLTKQGKTKHEALWTLIRFFKSINEENRGRPTEEINDLEIGQYQRELLRILHPEAKIIPLTSTPDIVHDLTNQSKDPPEPS